LLNMLRLVRFVAIRPDQNRAALYTPLNPHPPTQNLYRPPSQFPHHTREQSVQARKERKKLEKAHRQSNSTVLERLDREQRKSAALAIFNRNNPEDGGKDHHKESPSRTRRALKDKSQGKVLRPDTPLRWTTGWDTIEEDWQWTRIDRNPPTTLPWDSIHFWKAIKTTCAIPWSLSLKVDNLYRRHYDSLVDSPGDRRPCAYCCDQKNRPEPRRAVVGSRWVRAASRHQALGEKSPAVGDLAVSPNLTCPVPA
jgi:hypothetical protein